MPSIRESCAEQINAAAKAGEEAWDAITAAMSDMAAYNQLWDPQDDPLSKPDPPDPEPANTWAEIRDQLDAAERTWVEMLRTAAGMLNGECRTAAEDYRFHDHALHELEIELADVAAECKENPGSDACNDEVSTRAERDEHQAALDALDALLTDCLNALAPDADPDDENDPWVKFAKDYEEARNQRDHFMDRYQEAAPGNARYNAQKEDYKTVQKSAANAAKELAEFLAALGEVAACASQHAWGDSDDGGGGDDDDDGGGDEDDDGGDEDDDGGDDGGDEGGGDDDDEGDG